MNTHTSILALSILPALPFLAGCSHKEAQKPNILIAIADDQSYPYTSAYGCKSLSTQGFDYVASHGTMFANAYSTSPGSSPSRASILTGLFPWQVEEAGTHASSFPSKYTCFPEVFAAAGYSIGCTGKGWGPGDWKVSGRLHNPAGPEYNDLECEPPYSGISKIDYFANFKKFLDENSKDSPFCFWYGAHEPHRPYEVDSWEKEGMSTDAAEVPGFLPDAKEVRGDIMDYAVEIGWFDQNLVKFIDELKRRKLLDNTIIIVTADNGMSFPHAKANCYDAGIHVPLAICWGKKIKNHQMQQALVSLVDIFPTLLELTGVQWGGSASFSGESWAPLLGLSEGSYHSKSVFAGRERHSCARYNNWGYPVRSIRSGNYLLIHNFHAERWPAGDPVSLDADGNEKWPYDAYYDIDSAPTKTYMIACQDDPAVKPYFDAAVAIRPEFELYNLSNDTECLHNVADNPQYSDVLESMKDMLQRRLEETGDTRIGSNPEIWETYPRLEGPMRSFPKPLNVQ